jgi:hypothetical protein
MASRINGFIDDLNVNGLLHRSIFNNRSRQVWATDCRELIENRYCRRLSEPPLLERHWA